MKALVLLVPSSRARSSSTVLRRLLLVLALAAPVTPAAAAAAAPDRDGDRMPDRWERRHRLDPTARDARRDPDRDRLANRAEFRARTHPHRRDTDGDGRADGRERARGTDPRRPDAPVRPGTPAPAFSPSLTPPVLPSLTPPVLPSAGADAGSPPAPDPAGPPPEPTSAPASPAPDPAPVDAAEADWQAQDALMRALAVALTGYGSGSYPSAADVADAIAAAEPDLTAHADATGDRGSAGPDDVAVAVVAPDIVTLCARSATRRVFCVRDDHQQRLGPAANARRGTATGATEPDARCVLPLRGRARSCVSATGVAGFAVAVHPVVRSRARTAVYLSASPQALPALAERAPAVGVLMPFWWRLDAAAQTVAAGGSNRVVDAVLHASQRHGFELWPVAASANTPEGNMALADPAARSRMVDAVLAQARALRVPGVSLDMEAMTATEKPHFTAFVRELAAALHADGRRLGVYSLRRVTADDAWTLNSAKAYDWAALAAAADLLFVALYNETAGTGVGPTATPAGAQRVLDYARAVSPAKTVPVVGLFGYTWPTAAGGTPRVPISTRAADGERDSLGLAGTEADGNITYTKPDGRTVAYQTGPGAAALVGQVAANGFAWWGAFSLDRAPDSFWTALAAAG